MSSKKSKLNRQQAQQIVKRVAALTADAMEAKSSGASDPAGFIFEPLDTILTGIRFRSATERDKMLWRIRQHVSAITAMMTQIRQKDITHLIQQHRESLDNERAGHNVRLDHEMAHVQRLRRAIRTLSEVNANAIIEAAYEHPPSTAVSIAGESMVAHAKAPRTLADVEKEAYVE